MYVKNWCSHELELSILELPKSSSELQEILQDETTIFPVPYVQQSFGCIALQMIQTVRNRSIRPYVEQLYSRV